VIVLDSSVAMSWFFEDERDDLALSTAQAVGREQTLVPSIFPWEFQNAMLTAVRRKRLSRDEAHNNLQAFTHLAIRIDPASIELHRFSDLSLALKYDLSAYDAAYLQVALRYSAQLMTRDQRLAKAARELNCLWDEISTA
jgi:predicted nucleic acid-binding protein